MKSNKGFSLVELIVSFAILAIAGTAIYGLMSAGTNHFTRTGTDVGLQYEQQVVVNRLRDTLIEASSALNYNNDPINDINELHIPNIITLITNNYREQLVYFEFLDVNNYGSMCQHLYLYERDPDIADIAPEFINVATSEDNLFQPLIDITVF